MDVLIDTVAEKRLFGKALGMFPGDPFKAACAVFPDDPGKCLMVAAHWINDLIVIEAKHEYIDAKGKPLNVPTKEELVTKILDMADIETVDFMDRLRAFELAAKLMDYMPKNNGNVQVNDNRVMNVTNKVMVVPTSPNNDEWEQRAKAQQARLVSAD